MYTTSSTELCKLFSTQKSSNEALDKGSPVDLNL